ncbi:MAG TPA: polysaccharide deacetylase [Firmicutes bacterium]|nr:polysaccharide deacetylase [Bacillota bacterium]
MIETGLTKNHLHLFLILTLILMMLAAGFNLVVYSQTTAALNQLREKHLSNQGLCKDLDYLNSKYSELQNRYNLLLKEKEALESRLNNQNISRGIYNYPTAYLTIDDGPGKYTHQILQILAEYNVPATFFVIGQNNSGDEHIYSSILEQGHALGNHTLTHNLNKIYLSKNAFMEDLLRLEDLLAQKTGVRPDIIRFPGGSSTTCVSSAVLQEIIAELKERGYDYFDWNISTGDCSSSLTAAKLVANVVHQADLQPGQDLVVLMHSFNFATVEALPQIIKELRMRGYTFAALKKGIINMKHR